MRVASPMSSSSEMRPAPECLTITATLASRNALARRASRCSCFSRVTSAARPTASSPASGAKRIRRINSSNWWSSSLRCFRATIERSAAVSASSRNSAKTRSRSTSRELSSVSNCTSVGRCLSSIASASVNCLLQTPPKVVAVRCGVSVSLSGHALSPWTTVRQMSAMKRSWTCRVSNKALRDDRDLLLSVASAAVTAPTTGADRSSSAPRVAM